MERSEIPGTSVNETEKLKELEKWKEKVAQAEKQKSDMLLSKLAADAERTKWQKKLAELKDLERKKIMEKRIVQEQLQTRVSELNEQNNDLRKEVQFLKEKTAAKNAKYEELAQRFWLRQRIPEKKVKFTRLENAGNGDAYMNISNHFRITRKPSFKLNQGEALITFEEEKVAQELIRRCYHTVSLENESIVLRALPVKLEMGMTFELHANISQSKINVSDIPNLNIPEEWMKEKLELNCYRTELGGGKVQNVAYDKQSQMALITFAQPAANNIVRYGQWPFYTRERTHTVMVSPTIQRKLERLQIFSGISKRTILLTGIKVAEEDEESVQDMIAIHFQKPSNGGGEVENIQYVSKGTKLAYFENDTDDVI